MTVDATQSAAAADTQSTSGTSTTPPVDKNMFMTLLVAQIKYQDPMNPSDGTQFLTQLAQFTELEQVIGIHDEVVKLNEQSGISNQGE